MPPQLAEDAAAGAAIAGPDKPKEAASMPAPAAAAAADAAKVAAASASAAAKSADAYEKCAYLRYLGRLREAWRDMPQLHIAFNNLSVTFARPVGQEGSSSKEAQHTRDEHATVHLTPYTIPTLWNQSVFWAKLPVELAARKFGLTFEPRRFALQGVNGVIEPASMTLVLAPPGHGKSSFLKALCGRLPASSVHGSLTYNGRTAAELAADGVQVKRLTAYVGQSDMHFATLTVRETVTFAAQCSVADAAVLPPEVTDPELLALDKRRADMLIDMIGLGECADTFVGNDMLRGVSGGQRKRVTLAEMMVSNARLMCLDEVSTGLDAAVTTSIFSDLRSMCRINGSSVVATLLQPTPDTYDLFDHIVLLHDGQVVFHGPRADVKRWLWEVCGLDVPAAVDEASFLMDFLVDPTMAYESAQLMAQSQAFAKATRADREASVTANDGAFVVNETPLGGAAEEKQLDFDEHGVVVAGADPVFSMATRPEVYEYETYSQVAGISAADVELRPQSNGTNGHAANGHATNGHAANGHAANHCTAVSPQVVTLHMDGDEDVPLAAPSNGQQKQPLSDSASPRKTSPMSGIDEPGGATPAHKSRTKHFASAPKHSTAPVAPVRDMADLKSRYQLTRWHLKHAGAGAAHPNPPVDHPFAPTSLDPAQWSTYTRSSFAQLTPHSPKRHMALCWSRQFKLFIRAVTIMVPRMAKALLIGLCYGLLFFQLSKTQFNERLAVVMYAGIFAAMTNLSELPVASEARNVIAKQLDAGFYRASPYTVAACSMHVPVTFVESICYSVLFYWLAGLEADGGRFLFHLLLCVLTSNCMAVFYRFISYVTPNPDIARQLDLPFVVLFIICNAYLVTYSQMPVWLSHSAYWISPLSWTTRSLAINEYSASTYDGPAPGDSTMRVGDYYLREFDLQTSLTWKWMGVVYQLGWMLVWMLLCTMALNRVGLVGPQGSEREHYVDVAPGEIDGSNERKRRHNQLGAGVEKAQRMHPQSVDIEMGVPAAALVAVLDEPTPSPSPMPIMPASNPSASPEATSHATPDVLLAIDGAQEDMQSAMAKRLPSLKGSTSQLRLTALPFTPVTLSWEHLSYSVTLANGNERALLHDINGFGVPGQMTALMGASGAGKTTLMDCCAGRKTTGRMTGRVMLNGQEADIRSSSFQQLCGYVEQNDLHIGTQTVEEALRFSAFLRLPISVPVATQHAFVKEVLVLLGLSAFAGHLIGDAAIPGLGPAQLKLVTIGVELVANPSILFLDEPTSGLDAPAAWRVMTAIKRIALTGRTVLCTIHQPSARLFFLFDRLMLLEPGGKTIYFHSIGGRGEELVSYLEAASNFEHQLQEGSNPADFALGLRSDPDKGVSWPDKWTHSRINQQLVLPLIAKHLNPANYTKEEALVTQARASTEISASFWQRYVLVQKRLFISYWRNSPMNLTRTVIAITLGFLIGLMYFQVKPRDLSSVNSYLAGLFMALLFGPSLSAIAALPTMFRQRAIFYRECTVRMYDVNIYQLTMTMTELLSLALLMMLYCLPHYFLMGLNPSAIQFFRFYLIVFLMAQVYASFAQLYLAFLPNQVAAAVVHAIVFAFFFVFGGLLITPRAYPDGFKWFFYMIPSPKAYVALALGQLACSDDPSLSGGEGCGYMTTPNSNGAQVQIYEFVAAELENSSMSFGNQVGWMVLEIAVVKIVTAIGFKFISHLKR